MFEEFGINAGLVEDLHARYTQSREAVAEEWRTFFDGLSHGDGNGNTNGGTGANPAVGSNGHPANGARVNGTELHDAEPNGDAGGARTRATVVIDEAPSAAIPADRKELLALAAMQGRVYQLVNAYRVRGHLFANLDPLGQPPDAAPELELQNFGLTEADLDSAFPTVGVSGLPERATLRQIVEHLSETYCKSIGVEFTHIEDPEEREWLQRQMESTRNRCELNRAEILRVLLRLTDAEIFEKFLHKNFQGAKRFSAEGAESMIAMLDLLIDAAGTHGIEEIVIAMAHRGRLNILANVMEKPVLELFAAFKDRNPERFLGGGDVKYHLGYSNNRVTSCGATVHLSLCFNPSHLEFVNPVAEGRVRAKQDRKKRDGVMPLLIHGDAAFIGQGIVPETLNMAGLPGYSTEGTIHLVVNNQIGFTTNPSDSRSTRYCTDITRMMKVPVFHVNGEDPEAVIQLARLAMEFRQKFKKDVIIDMYCYRRYGHNEGDEPRFTQPLMYRLIDAKPTVREVYVDKLVASGQVTREAADKMETDRRAALAAALEQEGKGDYMTRPSAMEGVWTSYYGGPDNLVPEANTAVDLATLKKAAEGISHIPEGFHAHAKVRAVLQARHEAVFADKPFDWGTGEHLAFATLAMEGARIRLSGQDAGRGTFTHRHAVLFDTETGAPFTPLKTLQPGVFEVFDSPLSEAGVLGFEYGYSLDWPDGLVIWEAQFGDFANGAQVIIDQFIVSAEEKWLRLSGLVLLLPHGYEGQGPEHSSARIERFLSMSAQDNIQVVNVTTPAQFFHVLRRQVLRPWRKPLVVFTPKSLLRHPLAKSTVNDLTHGGFQRVIPDADVAPKDTKRVLLCSGKLYYDLLERRTQTSRTDVAIVRLEQLYPIGEALKSALAVYPEGTPLYWVQEEPRNMGAWYFLHANLASTIGSRLPVTAVCRAAAATPATGSHASHKLEQSRLLDEAFG